MLLFLGLAAAPETTDAQTADYNQRWGAWMGALAAKGALVAGGPFQPHGSLVSSDGVAELRLERVDIGGFVVIEVDSDEAANEIAGSTPHVELGGETIVRPLVELPPAA
jgi:hypothetical protein